MGRTEEALWAQRGQTSSALYIGEILISPSLYEVADGRDDVERLSHPAPMEVTPAGAVLTRV